jgi:uncharacterized protein with HEPN domain
LPFDDRDLLLVDIQRSIQLIEEFVEGLDLDAYRRDIKTQAAVERMLLVISEGAIRLRDRAESLCPTIPWREIRGIGNWLRHSYDRVDAEIVWDTIRNDLPALKTAINSLLESNKPEE